LTSQHRSSQRYRRRLVPEEQLLRQRLQLLARRRPPYGYRRIHAIVCREGWTCNRKRVQRLWRDEGLRLPAKTKRRRRGPGMPGHLSASCPDQVWAIDFVSDRTADGRPLKILTVTDEHTREALATPAARRMGADEAVDTIERIVECRGRVPTLIRCDNGPEFISRALRDWCRFKNTKTGYIEPGAPWQNPFVESFNGHLRRELLEMESFNTLFEAQLLLDDWRLEYNQLPTTPIAQLHDTRRIRAPSKGRNATRTLITTGPKSGVRSLKTSRSQVKYFLFRREARAAQARDFDHYKARRSDGALHGGKEGTPPGTASPSLRSLPPIGRPLDFASATASHRKSRDAALLTIRSPWHSGRSFYYPAGHRRPSAQMSTKAGAFQIASHSGAVRPFDFKFAEWDTRGRRIVPNRVS
jgi:transposase InsO family protein